MRKSDLTPEQLECVEFDKLPHFLIKGPPGSGKTMVLLFRGQHLASQHLFDLKRFIKKNPRGAEFVTFTHSLTTYAAELNEQVTGERITEASLKTARVAQTCLQFFWDVMSQLQVGKLVIEGARRQDMISRSIETVRRGLMGKPGLGILNNPMTWWLDEFRWIKGTILPDGRLILTCEDYKAAERRGRGSALQPGSREMVWRVFETYENLLRAPHHRPADGWHSAQTTDEIDFDDYARRVTLALCRRANTNDCRQVVIPAELESYRADHLLVDESQAMSQLQLLLLSKFARKSVTLVVDEAQSIYKSPFTYESIGFEFTPNNVRTLRFSFRSTRQIQECANALRGPEAGDQDTQIEVPRTGPIPTLHVASTIAKETELIAHLILEEQRNNPDKTIGVLVRMWDMLRELDELLSKRGIIHTVLRLREQRTGSRTVPQHVKQIISPGVKLLTYHAAQGLEFDLVILTHVTEGVLPINPRQYHGEMAQVDEAEFLASERRLLYVGMTRARHVLHMTCVEPRSRFLCEPYATAYETAGEASPVAVAANGQEEEEMIDLDEFDDIPF